MPALSRLRLLGVEPSGGDRLPELRLRRDGGEAVQGDGGHGGRGGHGGHAEVTEVRTRSDGGGGGPGGAGRDLTAVVAGGGLAGGVAFADQVQRRVTAHPKITVAREEASALPSPGVLATGPLTSEALAGAIARRLDASALAFFDAIAPIVSDDSLDHDRLFRASRYGKGGGDDYWNAPLTAAEYDAFVTALDGAEQHRPHHEFDRTPAQYFEGCLPIEELAER